MGRKKKVVPLAPRGMDVGTIIALTRQHYGFAKLNPSQRRLLIAGILAAVVPCDGKVLEVELQHFLGHLKTRYAFSAMDQQLAMDFVKQGFSEVDLFHVAQQLPELLSAEDRATLVGLMWDIACADQELHAAESDLIMKIADCAGVVRKRALEEKARAARANGMMQVRAA